MQKKIKDLGLHDTQLIVNQSGNGTDIKVLTNDLLKNLYERNEALIKDKDSLISFLERELAEDANIRMLGQEIAAEAKINHAGLQKFSLARTIFNDLKKQKSDTLLAVYADFEPTPTTVEIKKFQDWLKVRTKSDTLALILK